MFTSSEFTMGGGGGVGVFWTRGFRTAMMSPKPGRSCGWRQHDAMRSLKVGCMSSVSGNLALAHPTAPTTCDQRGSRDCYLGAWLTVCITRCTDTDKQRLIKPLLEGTLYATSCHASDVKCTTSKGHPAEVSHNSTFPLDQAQQQFPVDQAQHHFACWSITTAISLLINHNSNSPLN